MTNNRVNINYKPLWKLLIDREMSKADLREKTSIARRTIMKITNNQNVAVDVLLRRSLPLDCNLDDIVEIEK